MSANSMQVGGQHYAGDYQHWDWVADVRLPYHQGNASKYVARWRKKNGVEDLQKAAHYLDKAIEINRNPSMNKLEIEGIRQYTARFVGVNGLTEQEGACLLAIALGHYGKAKDIVTLMVQEQPVG